MTVARTEITETASLAETFIADHREITRGLSRLSRAVRDGDLPRARRIAARLDRLAGPHIQFEEEVLYPYIAGLLGREYAARLYDEHASGRSVIERLTCAVRSPELGRGERDELLRQLNEAIEHAATCATLVSHLSELSPEKQASMRGRLEECRQAAPPWTQLPRSLTDDSCG